MGQRHSLAAAGRSGRKGDPFQPSVTYMRSGSLWPKLCENADVTKSCETK
jgi:hypothetical protein